MQTTVEFLADVRREGSLSVAAPQGTADLDLLAHGTKVLQSVVSPLLRSIREEYYTRVFDISTQATVGAYRLPKRATGCAARTAEYVDTNGQIYPLKRVEPERAHFFQPQGSAVGRPWAFYLEGSRVVLVATPATPGTLRLRCQVRPGSLVSTLALGSVVEISQVTDESTPNLPAPGRWGLGTLTTPPLDAASVFDVVAGTAPFEYLAVDASSPGIDDTFIALLKSDFSTAPQVGDWVVMPDTSPVIQVPPEAYLFTVAATAHRVMLALGRDDAAAKKQKDVDALRPSVIASLAPRTQGQARKIVGGTMRWGSRTRFG